MIKDTYNTKDMLTLVHLVLRDENGNIKQERFSKNIITTAGKAYIASRMVGSASAAISHMAVGQGSTAAVVGDTILETEAGRAVLTSQTAVGSVVTVAATFGPGVGTGILREAGVLNAATDGDLLNRTIFDILSKAAGDTLTINWTITLT